MRKSTIAPLWLGGLAGIAAGLVAVGLGTVLMLAYGGTYGGPGGHDFVPTQAPFFWWMVGLIVAGSLVAVTGGFVQLVAWIGALLNTYASPDKTWFVVLLVGGLLGVVFIAAPFVVMVVYLIIGPDVEPSTSGTAPVPPASLAPAS